MAAYFFTIAITLFIPAKAFAYLDPGTGSMILQLLVAGVAGMAVGFKFYWRRLAAWFRGSPAAEKDSAEKIDSK